MIRPFLEFLIERSLDRGVRPPGWLRWLARRNPQLLEHSQQVLELDRLLRSAAVTRRHELASEATAANMITPMVRRPVEELPARPTVRLAWLATAAAAVVAFVIGFERHTQQSAKADQVRLVTTQLVEVPNEMLSLFSEAAQVPQELSPLVQLKLPEVNPWSDIPRGTQGQLRESLSNWGSQLSDLGERVYERFDFRSDAEIN